METEGRKKMALIASRGTLDGAYPPFLLAATGAAMNMEVWVFFTFYGLPLLKKDLKPALTPVGNPAMPFRLPFGPKWFRKIDWPVPRAISGNVPGFESMATAMMKKTFKEKGVASVEDLRETCVESEVNLIACQMTMDAFGFEREEFIEPVQIGGAATFLEYAAGADIQLFL